MNHKRGMSGVIVNLIIIGIALVAVGVVWYSINIILEEQEGEIMSSSSNIFSNPKSCLEILEKGYSSGDGEYYIYPLGNGIEVYCDMTTDGGGWTLVAVCRPEDNPSYPSYNSAVPYSDCWNTGAVGEVADPESSVSVKLSDVVIKTILINGESITRTNWKQTYRYSISNPTNHMVYNLISNPNQWSSSGCGSQGKEFYYKANYDSDWGSPLYSGSTGCSCAVNGWSNTREYSCGNLGTWQAGCERAPSASHCCACVTYDERADLVVWVR